MKSPHTTFKFALNNSVQVIGRNAESAEPGNPRGEFTGRVHHIEAIDGTGVVFVHYFQHTDKQRVEKLLERIRAAIESGVDVDPGSSEHWNWSRCVYGSRAWREHGCEMEQIEEEWRNRWD